MIKDKGLETVNKRIILSEGRKEIIFIVPITREIYVCPDTYPYNEFEDKLNEKDLKIPTSPQTISLFYSAFQNIKGEWEFPVSQNLSYLNWESTGNLYLPKSNEEVNNGVILEINPLVDGRGLKMNKSKLIKRLQDNDPLVRFVPFGFKIGDQSWKELEKNPYVQARYGEEGAERMAKLASSYSTPRLNSFNSISKETRKLSGLSSTHWFGTSYLNLSGNLSKLDKGYAHGIQSKKIAS
mgnify:CR=1 FL=1|jgi:hypothetical protein